MQFGIAVATDSLMAVRYGPAGQPMSRSVSVHDGDHATAFIRLRMALEAAGCDCDGATADLVLLPPFADARVLQLPRLRRGEAEMIVRRDAARHFVGMTGSVVTGVSTHAAKGNGMDVLAAVAPESQVERLRQAAVAAGWTVRRIIPAHAAWLAAAADSDAVVAVHDGTAHVLRRSAGAPVSIRRAPVDDAALLASLLDGARSIRVLADRAARQAIEVLSDDRIARPDELDAAAAAAAAAQDTAFELTVPALHAARAHRERRLAARLAVAALLLLVTAAGVQLWGAHRELDAIRQRRAEIREEVEPLLALRDSADQLARAAAEIDSAGSRALLSGALFDVSVLLPTGTWLTRLHAVGDTITLDGTGPRAGAALQALKAAGSLRDVRLVGAVQRELEDGSTTAERFRITARVAGMPAAAELAGPPDAEARDAAPPDAVPDNGRPHAAPPADAQREVW